MLNGRHFGIWKSQAQHDDILVKVLHRLKESGLTLNTDKRKFSQSKVRFLSHIVGAEGIHPDPHKIKAITQVKTPQTTKDVRRFLGMLNQMIKFVPNLADTTKPLRDLLSTKNQWVWEQRQEEAFNKAKIILSSAPVLALFDPNLETTVSSDASSFGLGTVLLQTQQDGLHHPVAYISRAMTVQSSVTLRLRKRPWLLPGHVSVFRLPHWNDFSL